MESLQIHNDDDRARLYEHCIDHINSTTQSIFKTGRGISRFSGKNDDIVDRVITAERRAAERGVEILRIQTGRHVIGRWASRYAELADDWQGRVRVYEDFQDETSLTIAVMDPDTDHPIVEILSETLVKNRDGGRFWTAAALFVHDNPQLAQSLKLQHIERAKRLELENRRMTPLRIKILGYDYLYLAYGLDLDEREMRLRAPGSTLVGWATLKDWKRDYWVPIPGTTGCWPGIRQEANSEVVGAMYAITNEDKAALDIAVGPRYSTQEVQVTCGDGDYDAVVYVPRDPYHGSGQPDRASLERMVVAARAAGVMQLW
ncbi:MAG: gamma-glutamylcyclotransferase, partial [Actinomycetota bacterium]|nr:gamma-glutamylcyclotransferase [Actinomycetota bacterium]